MNFDRTYEPQAIFDMGLCFAQERNAPFAEKRPASLKGQ